MFGYVTADAEKLTQDEFIRYRSLYCGLCRKLREKGGFSAQLTLTYDMTFAILVLSSLYEPKEEERLVKCHSHAFAGTKTVSSEITDYCADMNIILAYYNILDDIDDDGGMLKKAEEKLLRKSFIEAENRLPEKTKRIDLLLKKLSSAENNDKDADTCDAIFGEIMSEVFLYKEDMWSGYLSDFAKKLGKVIYIMDAVDDIEKDIKKGSFNPLKDVYNNTDDFTSRAEDILKNLLGECTEAFEKLPLERDIGIMRNILCSGIWTKMYSKRKNKA